MKSVWVFSIMDGRPDPHPCIVLDQDLNEIPNFGIYDVMLLPYKELHEAHFLSAPRTTTAKLPLLAWYCIPDRPKLANWLNLMRRGKEEEAKRFLRKYRIIIQKLPPGFKL